MNNFTFTMDDRFGKKAQDNDNYLVDGFSVFYSQRASTFPESKHIFDVEDIIKKEFNEQKESDENLSNLDITFIDSDENYFIQVSDVVAGLFQRYFNYLNTNKIIDIKSVRSSLNPIQLKNMDLFKSLINKSDAENKKFLYYIMSKLEHEKHIAFTFPEYA